MKTLRLWMTGWLLIALAVPGLTQNKTVEDTVRRVETNHKSSLKAVTEKATPVQDRGTAASDFIRGNGSRAGYNLSRGGIIPNSECVTVDGSMLTRNVGYFLDELSGTLAFAEPVRTYQTVRITYRYDPNKDKQRTTIGSPSLALNIGPNTSMGISLAQNTTANQAYDLMTYGVNLKTNLNATSTMNNIMYMSSAKDSGRVTPSMNGEQAKTAEKPKADNLFLHNTDLKLGKATVKLNYQDVGKDFAGFNAMRQEKAVADAVIGQLEKEKGLRRLGVQTEYDLGNNVKAGIGWDKVGDSSGDVINQSLSLVTGRMKLSASIREIDEAFAKLKSLTAQEQAAIGGEIGMKRMNMAAEFKLSADTQMNANYSNVEDKNGGVVKYGVAVKSQKFDVAANYQDIDPDFKRVADLNDPNKKAMAAEQGMKRYDITTRYEPNKNIKWDSFMYDARHSTEDLFKRQLRNNIVVTGKGLPKLSLLFDGVESGQSDAIDKYQRQRFIIDHKLGQITLNAMQDTVERETSSGEEKKVETQLFKFATDPKQKTSLSGEWKNVDRNDGTFEETQILRLNTKLSSKLDFAAVRSTVETEEDETMSHEYSLTGTISKDIALKSKFGETLVNGATIGKVRELSLVPGSAKDYGAFKKFKWNMGFGEVQTANGHVQTRTKSAGFETEVLKHALSAGYTGAITKEGATPVVRYLSLTGDKDAKKRLHYSLSYKVHDPGADPSLYIRKYAADYRLSKTTALFYNYSSYNEKAGGKLEPIGVEKIKLTTMLNDKLSLVGQWESLENFANNTDKNTLSLGVAGKLSKLAALEASYGYDSVITSSGKSSSRTYKLKYDYQMDSDHFLMFSGKYTDWSGPKPTSSPDDDVRVQLDLRKLFN